MKEAGGRGYVIVGIVGEAGESTGWCRQRDRYQGQEEQWEVGKRRNREGKDG